MQHVRYNRAKKVTLIGAIINALSGCIKLATGYLFHSHALIADGFHSFSDLVTDITVLFASKYGSQDADDTHPYGHQRIETAATLLVSFALVSAGVGIAWDSCYEIIHKDHTLPNKMALVIAFLSIVVNEGLFHYTKRVGIEIGSQLVIANAWHHRSDAAASLVVLLGLIGSLAGYIYFDPIAAIVVGLMIVKMGFNYGFNSVKELVDTGVEPQILAQIEKIILQINGVIKVHQLRSRLMGQDIFIDVHIQVSPSISVSEGHFIAQHVHQTLIEKLELIKDVTVHVDPEDDETTCPSVHLPNRKRLQNDLFAAWQLKFPGIQNILLHYLDGELTIDLTCSAAFKEWAILKSLVEEELKHYKPRCNIRFFKEV